MYGLRGLTVLLGGGAAGVLIWRAAEVNPQQGLGRYWAAMAMLAGAGLVMALSQQALRVGSFGRFSGLTMMADGFFAYLPLLFVGTWIVLAGEPGGWWGQHINNWSSDIGIGSWVATMAQQASVIAFGLGLAFGFCLTHETVEPAERAVDRDLATARDRAGQATPAEDVVTPSESVTREPVGVDADDYRRDELVREPVDE